MKKHRFEKEFYEAVVSYKNKTGLSLKDVCRSINNKVHELSGLISPNGAIHILLQELR